MSGADRTSVGRCHPASHHPSSPPLATITAGPEGGSVVVVDGSVVVAWGVVPDDVGTDDVVTGAGVVASEAPVPLVGADVPAASSGRIGPQAVVRVIAMARPTVRDFFLNWTRSELSVPDRIRQGVKNNRIKLERGSECCGNHGEVGC